MQLLAKIATKLNLAAPNFKNFRGPPPSLETACHIHTIFNFKSPLFPEKNHPTESSDPSYGPGSLLQSLIMHFRGACSCSGKPKLAAGGISQEVTKARLSLLFFY